MIEKIRIEQLTDLMASQSPEEIRTRHWDQMDDESRAHFEAFIAFCDDLDTLPATLALLAPSMPEVVEEADVVPFRPRRGRPALGMPLIAVATFVLGMLVPVALDEATEHRAVTPVRSEDVVDVPTERLEHDHRIADSYFERGIYLHDVGDLVEALHDLEQAHLLNPTDQTTLEYLMVVTEELGHDRAYEEYKARLDSLEQ